MRIFLKKNRIDTFSIHEFCEQNFQRGYRRSPILISGTYLLVGPARELPQIATPLSGIGRDTRVWARPCGLC